MTVFPKVSTVTNGHFLKLPATSEYLFDTYLLDYLLKSKCLVFEMMAKDYNFGESLTLTEVYLFTVLDNYLQSDSLESGFHHSPLEVSCITPTALTNFCLDGKECEKELVIYFL